MVWSDALVQVLVDTCVGRTDRYLVQQGNGRYCSFQARLTSGFMQDHLAGRCTLASYVITEEGLCRFVVFDADADDGLFQLFQVQQALAEVAVPSYLERSRRGGHLWVFLAQALPPRLVRRALLSYCLPGMEFFPAHETADFEHPGYAVRLPLGVHRKSGRRYPFVEYSLSGFIPYASTVGDTLAWLKTVERPSGLVLSHLAEVHSCEVAVPPSVLQSLGLLVFRVLIAL